MKKTVSSLLALALLTFGLTACSPLRRRRRGRHTTPAASSFSAGKSTSTGCGAAGTAAGESTTVRLTVDGTERSYLVTIPKGYEAHTPTPVILAFHGRGRDAQGMKWLTGFSEKPAIAVYPQGLKGDQSTAWQGASYSSGADDVALTGKVLDSVEDQWCVDTTKIFAAGMSNGRGGPSIPLGKFTRQ